MKKASKKIIPPHNITCPYGGSILKFYKDHFEAVYLVLLPFMTLKNPKNDLNKENKRLLTKKIISENYEKMYWSEVLEKAEIESLKKLDKALREYIGAIRVSDSTSLNQLKKVISTFDIIPPTEGFFHELLIDDMMISLKTLGFDKIFIGDEFGSERRSTNIDAILDNQIELYAAEYNIYTPKNEVLFSTHWDSHFMLICSTKNYIEKILETSYLEGFYCTQETSVYWGLDK